MGAEYQTYTVTAKNVTELKTKANELREDARYDQGHSGYSGTIAEDNGKLKIIKEEMSPLEAGEYISENAEKWEETIAVKIKGEKDLWLLGGIYSS